MQFTIPPKKPRLKNGVRYMDKQGREIFFVGAGFSAPASLPTQNRILTEITKPTSDGILEYDPQPESLKFLSAYIQVGIFLLCSYSNVDCKTFTMRLAEYNKKYPNIKEQEFFDDQYKVLLLLKEEVRSELENANLQINLEDVFTSFDKSYQGREYLKNLTYYKADIIRESITRLFVYYFCKCTNNHNFASKEYITFCNYLKTRKNVSIISTNWDVLIEEYFKREKIEYNLCFNEKYYIDKAKAVGKSPSKIVDLIKLHGSINWFKCMNCGTINIVDNNTCGRFLFEDSTEEHCMKCGETTFDDGLLQPQIITPTMIKSINNQLYNNLWFAASNDLREAKRITFIGYTLPLADFELRYLLGRCVPKDIPIDVVLTKSADPAQTEKSALKELLPEKRYRDLFFKNKLTFYYDGFEEYFNERLKM